MSGWDWFDATAAGWLLASFLVGLAWARLMRVLDSNPPEMPELGADIATDGAPKPPARGTEPHTFTPGVCEASPEPGHDCGGTDMTILLKHGGCIEYRGKDGELTELWPCEVLRGIERLEEFLGDTP